MAITVTPRDSRGSSVNATAWSSNSISPTGLALLIDATFSMIFSGSVNVHVDAGGFNAASALATSLDPDGNKRLTAKYRVLAATPGSDTIDYSITGTQLRWATMAVELAGFDPAAPIRQFKVGNGTGTAATFTFDSALDPDSAVLFIVAREEVDDSPTWGSGLTQTTNQTSGSEQGRLMAAWGNDGDTFTASWATSADYMWIAIEIAIEPTGDTFTGSGTPSQAAQTAAGTGNFDVPTYTAAGTPAQASQTAAGTGNFDPPAFTGSGTPSQAPDTATGVGNFDIPVYTGSGAPTQGADTATGVGNFDAPAVYNGAGTPAQEDDTSSGVGSFTPPSFTGSGSPTQAPDTATGAANFDVPVYTGTGTPTQANDTAAGVGTFDVPVYTGTGAPSQENQVSTGVGEFSVGDSGSGSPTQEDDTATGVGTYTPGPISGSGAPTQDDQTATGVGDWTGETGLILNQPGMASHFGGDPARAAEKPVGVVVVVMQVGKTALLSQAGKVTKLTSDGDAD